MAVYSVDSSGKARSGLNVGDYVVTKNGTYVINGVKSDGSYDSRLYDGSLSLSNYNGQLGSLIGSGNSNNSGGYNNIGNRNTGSSNSINKTGSSSTISQSGNTMNWGGYGGTATNPGEGILSYDSDSGRIIRTMPNGSQWYADRGDEKWPALYAEYMAGQGAVNDAVADMSSVSVPTYQPADTSALEAQVADLQAQLANQQYTPVDTSQYTENVMSYDEALAYAERLLAPKYDAAYQQAAENAAQNLDRAGIGNSLYGQQLAMSQQNAVTNERQQAINDLALSLVGQDRQYALNLLNYAINENQFGANYQQTGLSQAANLSIDLINTLVSQAQAANDYNLQAASLELQKQAQRIEALYTAGLIEKTDAEMQLLNLEIEATKAANTAGYQLGNNSGGNSRGGQSSVKSSGGNNRGSYVAPPAATSSGSAPSLVSIWQDVLNRYSISYEQVASGKIPEAAAREFYNAAKDYGYTDDQIVAFDTASVEH